MKTILIVEDDKNFTRALQLRLESAGYNVLSAADGVTGLQLAQHLQPDLAILDFWIPNGAGASVAFRLKQQFPGMPFIFLTGEKREEIRKAAFGMGAAGFFEKPYDPKELMAAVERVIAGETERPESETVEPPAEPVPAPRFKQVSAESPAPADRNLPRLQLLIIEDDPKIARALGLRVKSAGYDVTLAHDALTGVNTALKLQPDLVLLDISMPGGDGFTVAERIQALIPKLIPIIFLTASKRTDFRKRAEDLGAVGYFEKPYRSEDLLHSIRSALARN